MRNLHKTCVKHLHYKLYYQQLHFKYLCNLARYWLQAVWGWHDSVETCSSVIICEIIAHLLVTVQNNKRCTVQCIKINQNYLLGFLHSSARFGNGPVAETWHKAERQGIYEYKRHYRACREQGASWTVINRKLDGKQDQNILRMDTPLCLKLIIT